MTTNLCGKIDLSSSVCRFCLKHPDSTECVYHPNPKNRLSMQRCEQQCDNCIRKGLRDCMYHGYPEDTIPESCAYKIGDAAVLTVYDVPTMTVRKQKEGKTDWCRNTYCPDCPDSDTCGDSKK